MSVYPLIPFKLMVFATLNPLMKFNESVVFKYIIHIKGSNSVARILKIIYFAYGFRQIIKPQRNQQSIYFWTNWVKIKAKIIVGFF